MKDVHQVLTGDLGDFTVLEELSVVVECHEDTGGGPRELVTKSIVGGLSVSRDLTSRGTRLTAGSGRPPQ